MRKNWIVFLTLILSACFGRPSDTPAFVNKPFPSFNLFLADSATYFNTNSFPDGKPVVLFFFGPYCPYSRAQMQEIVEHMDLLKDIQFCVLTTSSFDEMKGFYNHYQLSRYQNIKTGVDYTSFFSPYYEVPGVPYTVVYGKDKKIKDVFVGKVSAAKLKNSSYK